MCQNYPQLYSFTLATLQNLNKPKPQPRSKMPQTGAHDDPFANMPNVPLDLPDIPSDGIDERAARNVNPAPNEDIDFDDLARRFEQLTKRK